MREMLQLQPRFLQQRGRRAMNLLAHRRFRAAYDLMLLRSAIGEVDSGTVDFWTEIQELSPQEQKKAFGVGGRGHKPNGRNRRQPAAY